MSPIGKIPQESARAGVEDDSQLNYMATDIGTDMMMHWMSDLVKDGGTALSSRARIRQKRAQGKMRESVENETFQVCPCDWNKVTSNKGPSTHQGKKKCLAKKGQSGRIDQYFLRSQSI